MCSSFTQYLACVHSRGTGSLPELQAILWYSKFYQAHHQAWTVVDASTDPQQAKHCGVLGRTVFAVDRKRFCRQHRNEVALVAYQVSRTRKQHVKDIQHICKQHDSHGKELCACVKDIIAIDQRYCELSPLAADGGGTCGGPASDGQPGQL
jgi:hypothetical protein